MDIEWKRKLEETKIHIGNIIDLYEYQKTEKVLEEVIENNQEKCDHEILLFIEYINENGLFICLNCFKEIYGWLGNYKNYLVLNLTKYFKTIYPDKLVYCDDNIEKLKELIMIFIRDITQFSYRYDIRNKEDLFKILKEYFDKSQNEILKLRK